MGEHLDYQICGQPGSGINALLSFVYLWLILNAFRKVILSSLLDSKKIVSI